MRDYKDIDLNDEEKTKCIHNKFKNDEIYDNILYAIQNKKCIYYYETHGGLPFKNMKNAIDAMHSYVRIMKLMNNEENMHNIQQNIFIKKKLLLLIMNAGAEKDII